MKFTEEQLEKAVIELLESVKIPHFDGETIHKEISDVLLRDDLKQFLFTQYANENITPNEVQSIIRQLDLLPSSSLYESNKTFINLLADGFTIKREDRNKKDLFIQLIDYNFIINLQSEVSNNVILKAAEPASGYKTQDNNIYKFVNQLEIQGYEKRIPDGILYVNGLPLVVIEFKSAVKEDTTIKDAYTQLTVRYRRDIPELFKYNAFCVISDGVNNKIGSLFAKYNYYYAWRKINPEDEAVDGIDSLYSLVKGLFSKSRLLDVIQNFIYFPDTAKDDTKIVCRYPQYYAARKIFENIKL
ncbi:MAG: type I restriction endonuclease, partial [Ignavibacteria bacterium]|nr:type I restriction endonuclease [Ignavibacteria bacterium]